MSDGKNTIPQCLACGSSAVVIGGSLLDDAGVHCAECDVPRGTLADFIKQVQASRAVIAQPDTTAVPEVEHERSEHELEEPHSARGVRIWELTSHSCRWPTGGRWERAEFFCGAPTEPGCSWCRDHHKQAFVRFIPSARRTAQQDEKLAIRRRIGAVKATRNGRH